MAKLVAKNGLESIHVGFANRVGADFGLKQDAWHSYAMHEFCNVESGKNQPNPAGWALLARS